MLPTRSLFMTLVFPGLRLFSVHRRAYSYGTFPTSLVTTSEHALRSPGTTNEGSLHCPRSETGCDHCRRASFGLRPTSTLTLCTCSISVSITPWTTRFGRMQKNNDYLSTGSGFEVLQAGARGGRPVKLAWAGETPSFQRCGTGSSG